MSREKRTAIAAASDRRQRMTDKGIESDERRDETKHQQSVEDDLERRMRGALDDVYRALSGEDERESDYAEVDLVSDLIH